MTPEQQNFTLESYAYVPQHADELPTRVRVIPPQQIDTVESYENDPQHWGAIKLPIDRIDEIQQIDLVESYG